jgi:predicted RNase H-like nuclease
MAISVDMPIGFSADGWREADALARRFIGPRRSSVFPPPPRALLAAEGDYPALNGLSKQIRTGLPKQTYNLLPKMRELDEVMTPALQQRVRETHPEVSFCALNDDCLRHAKRSHEGRRERLQLLMRVYGPIAATWRAPRGAALDDVYDAAVLAWSASRVARGEAVSMPSKPVLDARGLRMEIVY